MEKVKFNGWDCVRLASREVELIVTTEVGPRIIRFGFKGRQNLMAEIEGQQGGAGEKQWMIRGGHRLWIAPEAKPQTYELDNVCVRAREIRNGVRTEQPAGPLMGVEKRMDITLDPKANRVKIVHTLTNRGRTPVTLAPWALSVMAPGGMAIIPLPGKVPHTRRLTHNQEWSIWGYTDFSDARWTLGSRYVFFRQDPEKGPNKLGIAHREGWVAYGLAGDLFVKRFKWIDGATYPDGGVNFETFSNEDFLELESLGPLVTLKPGRATVHEEQWELHRNVPRCKTEADVEKYVVKRLRSEP
jgi:hypothetical protein